MWAAQQDAGVSGVTVSGLQPPRGKQSKSDAAEKIKKKGKQQAGAAGSNTPTQASAPGWLRRRFQHPDGVRREPTEKKCGFTGRRKAGVQPTAQVLAALRPSGSCAAAFNQMKVKS